MGKYIIVIHDKDHKHATSSYGDIYETLVAALAAKQVKENDNRFRSDILTRDKVVSVAEILDLDDMEVVRKAIQSQEKEKE